MRPTLFAVAFQLFQVRATSAFALPRVGPLPSSSSSALAAAKKGNHEGGGAEHAALLPGHAVRIRIGDVSSSRKAWKKRRRAASPLLIPCSVLGMEREGMVRWNVEACLRRFGEEMSGGAGGGREVGMTSEGLTDSYHRWLGGSLEEHADAILGSGDVDALLHRLFDNDDDNVGGSVDVYLAEDSEQGLVLRTGLTRRQARSSASAAGLVQFRPEDDAPKGDRMIHTGIAKVRTPSPPNSDRRPKISLVPLGAALRVSPPADTDAESYEGETTSRLGYQMGDEINAFVYSYDAGGDNGSPLLTLSLDGPSARGGRAGQPRHRRARNLAEDSARDVDRELGDLSAGDGPFPATVVTVSSHSNSVFLDCGVGRKRGKKFGGGVARALGMLRFDDATEDSATDLQAGDELEVYVKAVFPQSGRFMVTTDPSVGGTKAKDSKREREAGKRRERLSTKFGEEDLHALIGNEYNGVVKAKSKTGNWYYVQPDGGDEADSLPVGVASFDGAMAEGVSDDESPSLSYAPGDKVRVRLEGIDEKRGQLSLTLLDLAP